MKSHYEMHILFKLYYYAYKADDYIQSQMEVEARSLVLNVRFCNSYSIHWGFFLNKSSWSVAGSQRITEIFFGNQNSLFFKNLQRILFNWKIASPKQDFLIERFILKSKFVILSHFLISHSLA